MSYQVQFEGFERAKELFGGTDKAAIRAAVSAINTAAREIRAELIQDTKQATGIPVRKIQGLTGVKRATQATLTAEIQSKSYGIPVKNYRYRMEKTSVPTRARILVGFIGGEKVAAGFINPASKNQLPLRTKSHKGKLKQPQAAYGPSIATAFARLTEQSGRLTRYRYRVAELYEDALATQLG